MLSAGAAVRVVAPRLTVRLTELLAQGRIEHRDHEYRPADLDNCALAVAATNDRALNRLIADDACAANILVNIVDAPELSSFIVPSTANRGRISVSVSTDGASPVLATHLRDEIDRMLGHQWSAVADALHDTRAALIEAIPDPAERSLAVSRLLRDGIDERIGAGTIGRDELVSAAMATPVGHVALIGAGPGDPGLLTLRGAALLGRADVVVHDRLGTERVLPLAHPRCELIDVGKAPGRHGMEQQDINELLVQLAARGLRVVRLKGGDPFIFGRGGEEALALADAGIAFEIVPGISSAIGGAGVNGIPLTHRAVAQSVTIASGHDDPTAPAAAARWSALGAAPGTLVLLMAMGNLASIATALIAAGRSAQEPACAIRWATTAHEQRVDATLQTLAEQCAAADLGNPAVVVIGPVVEVGREIAQALQRGRATASQLPRQ
jgi:uroporphyrin-III C-methyltransferase/precorrin-2 dehydrogenase/sirohydrochlorin ferrochelatase